jgi:hypothetical protein
MGITKIQPGVLVALKTSIDGGARYTRQVLEHVQEGRADHQKVMVEREIPEVEEYEQAIKVRQWSMDRIRSRCIRTPFGLMVKEVDWPVLQDRIDEARAHVDQFNATSTLHRVRVNVVPGKVAHTEEEAVRSIREEIGELLEGLERATLAGDVKELRRRAAAAKDLGKMLEDNTAASGALAAAVTEARRIGRSIVKRVEGAGEKLEAVLAEHSADTIARARHEFLDAGDVLEELPEDEQLPGVAMQRAAGDELAEDQEEEDQELEPAGVACPKCKAQAGEPCYTSGGSLRRRRLGAGRYHGARHKAVVEVAEPAVLSGVIAGKGELRGVTFLDETEEAEPIEPAEAPAAAQLDTTGEPLRMFQFSREAEDGFVEAVSIVASTLEAAEALAPEGSTRPPTGRPDVTDHYLERASGTELDTLRALLDSGEPGRIQLVIGDAREWRRVQDGGAA